MIMTVAKETKNVHISPADVAKTWASHRHKAKMITTLASKETTAMAATTTAATTLTPHKDLE